MRILKVDILPKDLLNTWPKYMGHYQLKKILHQLVYTRCSQQPAEGSDIKSSIGGPEGFSP